MVPFPFSDGGDDDKSIDRYDERVELKLPKVFKWNPHMPHHRHVAWFALGLSLWDMFARVRHGNFPEFYTPLRVL